MKRITLLLNVMALLAVSCSVKEELEVLEPRTEPANEVEINYLPGIAIVKFDDDMLSLIEHETKSPELDAVMKDLGITSMERIFPYAGEFEPRTRKEGLHRYYRVHFGEGLSPTKASASLADVPGVISACGQLPMQLRGFNDPYFNSQWHYVNTRFKGADINVQKVWDEFTVGSSNVIVSVVDEGVLMTHEDLVDNLIPCNPDGSGSYNFNNNTPNVITTQGHGTHVAGIIAAVSNNGKGVAGVAGGDAAKGKPGVKVMSCQIFDLYGNEPDIYQAIKHGADHGAVILQCSWGFSPDLNGDGFTTDEEIAAYRSVVITDPVLEPYKAAIDYFIKYAGCDNDGNQLPDSPMKGGVAVFAAGNDNFDYDPLVSYTPIIAVGSFGISGSKSSFSNYGYWVDVAAPGGDSKYGIYSTLLSNSYGGNDWVGTSMACPHVSGVAALLVSYFGGPGFTADECRKRIVRGADPNYFTGSYYIGRKLDAYGAFTYDVNTPSQAPVLRWDVDVSAIEPIPYNSVAEIPFTIDDPLGLEVAITLEGECEGCTVERIDGCKLVVDGSVVPPGKHEIRVVGTNDDSLSSSISIVLMVLENRAPEKSPDFPSGALLSEEGESAQFILTSLFTDPDGDALSFTIEQLGDSKIAVSSIDEGTSTLSIVAVAQGNTTVKVKATDSKGASTVAEIPLVVWIDEEPVSAYPNPATDNIFVRPGNAESAWMKVSVYSQSGALVLSEEADAGLYNPFRLNISSLSPGVYVLETELDGTVSRRSFVKM